MEEISLLGDETNEKQCDLKEPHLVARPMHNVES